MARRCSPEKLSPGCERRSLAELRVGEAVLGRVGVHALAGRVGGGAAPEYVASSLVGLGMLKKC